MRRRFSQLTLILATSLLVGCDHITKIAAKNELRSPLTLIRGVFDLTYAENHDTAFGILGRLGIKDGSALIFVVSILMLIGVATAWFMRRNSASKLESWAYVFVFAGALGNVIDRVVRGYVIDFMHVHYWPVFNVADCAIVVGAALFFIASRKNQKDSPEGGAPPVE